MTKSDFTDTCPPAGGGGARMSGSDEDITALLPAPAYPLRLDTPDPAPPAGGGGGTHER
jgi:hypothetical protein